MCAFANLAKFMCFFGFFSFLLSARRKKRFALRGLHKMAAAGPGSPGDRAVAAPGSPGDNDEDMEGLLGPLDIPGGKLSLIHI